MADIQIGVNQGDTVYYFDQSVGNIVFGFLLVEHQQVGHPTDLQ